MSDWRRHAACKGRTDLTWHPNVAGRPTLDQRAAIEAACAVCHDCPVLATCQQEGQGEYGIWGGAIQHFTVRADVGLCGTTAGYARHRRYREHICDACRLANNRYQRGRVARATEARAASVRQMLGRTG